MTKITILSLILLGLAGCTSVSDIAMAVDDHNIYYQKCTEILCWHKCEIEKIPAQGTPKMQRIQKVIADNKIIKEM